MRRDGGGEKGRRREGEETTRGGDDMGGRRHGGGTTWGGDDMGRRREEMVETRRNCGDEKRWWRQEARRGWRREASQRIENRVISMKLVMVGHSASHLKACRRAWTWSAIRQVWRFVCAQVFGCDGKEAARCWFAAMDTAGCCTLLWTRRGAVRCHGCCRMLSDAIPAATDPVCEDLGSYLGLADAVCADLDSR